MWVPRPPFGRGPGGSRTHISRPKPGYPHRWVPTPGFDDSLAFCGVGTPGWVGGQNRPGGYPHRKLRDCHQSQVWVPSGVGTLLASNFPGFVAKIVQALGLVELAGPGVEWPVGWPVDVV
jgi:hypothetical protein